MEFIHRQVIPKVTPSSRGQMAALHGAVKMFDRGLESMDALKLRWLAETGLAPSQQPQFSKRAIKAAAAG